MTMMMTNNETLADIVAEMRTYFQAKKRGNPEHRPWHQVLSDWADRAEAAAERERAALASPARNCDRFANTAQALGAYPDGPPVGDDWDDADWMMLLDWLFAKAKEAPNGQA